MAKTAPSQMAPAPRRLTMPRRQDQPGRSHGHLAVAASGGQIRDGAGHGGPHQVAFMLDDLVWRDVGPRGRAMAVWRGLSVGSCTMDRVRLATRRATAVTVERF